jgi:hypothetical protein
MRDRPWLVGLVAVRRDYPLSPRHLASETGIWTGWACVKACAPNGEMKVASYDNRFGSYQREAKQKTKAYH